MTSSHCMACTMLTGNSQFFSNHKTIEHGTLSEGAFYQLMNARYSWFFVTKTSVIVSSKSYWLYSILAQTQMTSHVP